MLLPVLLASPPRRQIRGAVATHLQGHTSRNNGDISSSPHGATAPVLMIREAPRAARSAGRRPKERAPESPAQDPQTVPLRDGSRARATRRALPGFHSRRLQDDGRSDRDRVLQESLSELAGECKPQAFKAEEFGHLLFRKPDSKLLFHRHDHRNMLERVPTLNLITGSCAINSRRVKLKNLGEHLFQSHFVCSADHAVTAPIFMLLGSVMVANQPGTARSASPNTKLQLVSSST